MFTRLLVFFALALSLASSPALAQPLSLATWKLANLSNEKLSFETFESERGTWQKQAIFPHQTGNFPVIGPDGKFRIATENRGFVEYLVRSGGSYTVGWDKTKGIWDMKRIGGLPVNAAMGNMPPGVLASFELLNRSNDVINFETLDPARNTWQKQTVYPHEKKVFSLSSVQAVGKMRVSTENRGFVMYDVHAGWKYSLLWDAKKGVWDFRTVQKGA